MSRVISDFPGDVLNWVRNEGAIESAVLYGSNGNLRSRQHCSDEFSDIDLHIIVEKPRQIYESIWSNVIPGHGFYLCTRQPATGGTTKVTVLFSSGQIDLVIVSKTQMRLVRWALRYKLHRKLKVIQNALNEMATSMRCGYHFIKGANRWGDVYQRVVQEMPGVRLTDSAICELADLFLVNMLLAVKRMNRGELIAAQYAIHRHLVETNLRFVRELRLRRGLPLPSFGLARHAEHLLTPAELSWIRINARLGRVEQTEAMRSAFSGLKSLTAELVPNWRAPAKYEDVIESAINGKRMSSPSDLCSE